MKAKQNNKSEKLLAKDLAIMKIEEGKEFETYFKKLYDFLSKRYDQEIELHLNLNDKVNFIQSLMDEITEALHDAKNKHKHQISELTEQHIYSLDGLRNVFEKRMNDYFYSNTSVNKNEGLSNRHKGSKPGRPKTITKSFIDYIDKNWTDKGKEAFIGRLKALYKTDITKDSSREKQSLNLLILIIFDEKVLDQKMNNKELFESVSKLLLGKIPNSQTNFNTLKNKGKENYSAISKYKKYFSEIDKLIKEIDLNYSNHKGK